MTARDYTLPPFSASRDGTDVEKMMLYDANKKSLGIGLILWLLLGFLGAHRFYMGRIGSALVIATLFLIGWPLSYVIIGFPILFLVGVWLIIDLFCLSGWVRDYNSDLARELAG